MKTLKLMLRPVILPMVMLVIFFMFSCKGGRNPASETGVLNSADETASKVPEVSFEKTEYDFGKIFSGEKVTYSFKFSNTGDGPLIILSTRSGCGCTVGDYPQEPIPPGGEAHIKVSFNSAGRRGFQSESVRVVTNAEPQQYLLRIKAEVLQN